MNGYYENFEVQKNMAFDSYITTNYPYEFMSVARKYRFSEIPHHISDSQNKYTREMFQELLKEIPDFYNLMK
jgi:hypothetical protein